MPTVRTGPRSGSFGQVALGLVAQVVVLGVLDGTVGLAAAGWIAGIAAGLAVTAALSHGLRLPAATALGPADSVTLVRSTLVGGVAALVADALGRPADVALMVTIASVALVLDAVDGWVARHTATASPLGARFDMEIDAFLILVLSVQVARSAGGWVLAIGLARYAFVAAGRVWPWLRRPTPPRYWCKTVAAIQGVVLTVAASQLLPWRLIDVVLVLALALLSESFGRDVLWLWRHRPHGIGLRVAEARPPAHIDRVVGVAK
jgi:phosphatidylglycerophosphate synthase